MSFLPRTFPHLIDQALIDINYYHNEDSTGDGLDRMLFLACLLPQVQAAGLTGFVLAEERFRPSFDVSPEEILKLAAGSDDFAISIAGYEDFFDPEYRSTLPSATRKPFLGWDDKFDIEISRIARTNAEAVREPAATRVALHAEAAHLVATQAFARFAESANKYGDNNKLIAELNGPLSGLKDRPEVRQVLEKYALPLEGYRAWRLLFNIKSDCVFARGSTGIVTDGLLMEFFLEHFTDATLESSPAVSDPTHPDSEVLEAVIGEFGGKVRLRYDDILTFRRTYRDEVRKWIDSVHAEASVVREPPGKVALRYLRAARDRTERVRRTKSTLKAVSGFLGLLLAFASGQPVLLLSRLALEGTAGVLSSPFSQRDRWIAYFVRRKQKLG